MAFAFMTLLMQLASFAADSKTVVVAKVNGSIISAADVDFAAMQQGVPAADRAKKNPELLDYLISRALIRQLLVSKKIEALPDELQFQIAKAEDAIRKHGEDPQKVFAKIGYTPDRLKSELGLPLAWELYVRQTVTPEQIKAYYDEHKQELDGTQLRGSHIILKLPKAAVETEITAKKTQLADLKKKIVAGQMSFDDAAKQFSDAPSKENGGDIGLFGWRGKLPPTVSQAAFSLKTGEISDPVVSPFGVHLIQVTERHPGEFSLEDVRTVILDRLSRRLWAETVDKLRATAKIERMDSK